MLTGAGLANGREIAQRLETLQGNYPLPDLDRAGAASVAKLMELVLTGVSKYPAPLETLGRALLVITGILQRTAYLALLTERPSCLPTAH